MIKKNASIKDMIITLQLKAFRDVVNNKEVLYHPLNKIISIRHRLYTKECIKKHYIIFVKKDIYAMME